MSLVTLTTGSSFQAREDSSILASATCAEILLPYSCKTGRCSTCKCKVLSGKTTALMLETGLTEQQKNQGWILSCVRTAVTDIVLEVDDLSGLTLPIAKTWPCRISQMNIVAPGVLQILLRLLPNAVFNFIPGQYIDVIGPDGIRRSYSLANADFVDKILELHIRAVDGGVLSEYWFKQAKINDLLRLNGPLGTFFLRETADIDLIFLATGTGIAPIKAMLESLINLPVERRPKSVTVLWGGRNAEDFYLNIADIPGGHTYIPVRSRPDANWHGAKGYVQDVLLSLAPDWKNVTVYACGSNKMIGSAQATLVDAGLLPSRFFSDAFVCSSSE